jgi:hypothetical protein
MKKQGTADRDVRESCPPTPKSYPVDPAGAGQRGSIEFKGSRSLYDDSRGFQSPAAKPREFHKGSQGKH